MKSLVDGHIAITRLNEKSGSCGLLLVTVAFKELTNNTGVEQKEDIKHTHTTKFCNNEIKLR